MEWLTQQWKRLTTFFQEVKAELQKTTWPTQKEVRNTTIVVIVLVMVRRVPLRRRRAPRPGWSGSSRCSDDERGS